MVTFSDLERVLEWARATNRRVLIYFCRHPYVLAVDNLIHAETRDGKRAPWFRAFGPKQPHQVLLSYKVEAIVIEDSRGSRRELPGLRELLEIASGK